MEFRHVSVLADETLHLLNPAPGKIFVDGTLGGGGHTERLLTATAPDGIVYGFDRDTAALAAAAERLRGYGDRLRLVHSNFDRMAERLREEGVASVDGFLLDLGVSSHQLDTAERGFSFMHAAPLDMRMDRSAGESAADLVNGLPAEDLERILREYGEERFARRIAGAIVREREREPILSTLRLAEVVTAAIPARLREDRIHPATRTFQGLRIAVNDELGSLERGLRAGVGLLRPGGRAAVISFHSLEDRIVKNYFRELATGCRCPREVPYCVCGGTPTLSIVTRKAVRPSNDEAVANPRSRSARLRVAEKQ